MISQTEKEGAAPFSWVLDVTKLRPGDVLLESGSSWVSELIRRVDGGPYSHALMYIGNGDLIEATTGGVRVISFARTLIADPGGWLLLRHPDTRTAGAAAAYARNLAHKHYTIFGAINSKLRIPLQASATGLFCSQVVADAYHRAGANLLPDVPPHQITPGSLVRCSAFEKIGRPPMQAINLRPDEIALLDRGAAYRLSQPHLEMEISQAAFKAVRPLTGALQPPPGSLIELLQALALAPVGHTDLADALLAELEKREYFDLFLPLLAAVASDPSKPRTTTLIASWRRTSQRWAREGEEYRRIARSSPYALWRRLADMHATNAALLALAASQPDERDDEEC